MTGVAVPFIIASPRAHSGVKCVMANRVRGLVIGSKLVHFIMMNGALTTPQRESMD